MDPDLDRLLREIDRGSTPPRATIHDRRERLRRGLRSRALPIALVAALGEVIALLVWRPSTILAVVVAGLLLVLAVSVWRRLRPGLGRDLVGLVAIVQAIVVAIPLVVLFSIGIGLIVALALVAGIVALILLRRS